MIRILLYLFFLVTSGEATDFVDDFPLFVEGDAGYISFFLDAAAALANNSEFKALIGMAVTISIAMSGWQMLRGGFSIPAKASATVIAGLTLMFAPVTVHIVDKRVDEGFFNAAVAGCGPTSSYRTVANVPYVIALPASATSVLGYHLKQMIRASTTPIINANNETISFGGINAGSVGMGKSKDIVKKIIQNASFQSTGEPIVDEYNYYFKEYIKGCFLSYAKIRNYSYDILYNPKGDLFNIIAPNALGLDASDKISYIPYGGGLEQESSCAAYWTLNLGGAKYSALQDKMMEVIQKTAPKCLNISALSEDLKDTGFIAISPDGVSKSIGSISGIAAMRSYITNAGANPSIEQASGEFGGSATVLANKMTTAYSKAKMQMEGTGGYHFAVEMLPNSIHFIYGIVLFLGILVAGSALAQTYEKAVKIYVGYMMSFAMFEAIDISRAIVDNAVMYFESANASAKLEALNLNGASFANMSAHLDNIATMTAISGTIGTMMIFAIPGVVLKGNFFSLMSMLGAPGQKYAGNDLDTAAGIKERKVGGDLAISNLMNNDTARKKLKAMGLDTPKGVGELEYYNNIQQQMSSMSSGAANMLTSDTLANQSRGAMVQQSSKNMESASFGANVNTASSWNVSSQNGQVAAQTINETSNARAAIDGNGNSWNANKVAKGNAISAVQKDFSSMSTVDAVDNGGVDKFLSGGTFAGRKTAESSVAQGEEWSKKSAPEQNSFMSKVRDLEKQSTFGGTEAAHAEMREHGGLDKAINDMITGGQEKGKSATTHAQNLRKSYGDDLKDNFQGLSLSETLKTIDQSKIDSQAGQAIATNANKSVNPNMYVDNAIYSEMSKQQSTSAAIAAKGGVAAAVDIDVMDASQKASQQKGAVGGLQEEAEKIGTAIGKSASEVMANTAHTMSRSKIASDTRSITEAGSPDAFVNLQSNSAAVKTLQQMGSTNGLLELSKEAKESYINGAMQKASEDSPERLAAVMKDFQKAGLIDKDGVVQSENWISGKEYLKANNLNSHNALVAGGMLFSGAAGENASVQANAMSSLTTGSDKTKFENHEVTKTGKGTQDDSGYNISATGLLQKALTETGISSEHAAEYVAELAKDGGIVLATDQLLAGGKGRKAATESVVNGYHKARGHEKGVDSNGKTVWGSADDLASKDYAKNENGLWEKNHSSSNGVGADLNQPTTNNKTSNATGVDNKANTGVDMTNSSNSDKKSIANNSETNKSPSISQQISEQYLKDKEVQASADSRNKEMSNLMKARDNQLSVASSPEAMEKINSDYASKIDDVREKYSTPMEREAMNHAKAEMAKPDLSAPKSSSWLSSAKSLLTDGAKGLGVGVLTDELVQVALDNGATGRANTYEAANNAMQAVGKGILGGVSTALGSVDAVAQAVTGHKPIGSAMAWAGITDSNNLFATGTKLVDSGAQNLANAAVNIGDAINGSNQVYGRTQGADTMVGSMLNYGSLGHSSSHANNAANIHAAQSISALSGSSTSAGSFADSGGGQDANLKFQSQVSQNAQTQIETNAGGFDRLNRHIEKMNKQLSALDGGNNDAKEIAKEVAKKTAKE